MHHARRTVLAAVVVALVLVGCVFPEAEDGDAPGPGGGATPSPTVEGAGADGRSVHGSPQGEGPEAREAQRARVRAREHLDYAAFSRPGLVDQLEFEGFTSRVARDAVDSLDVDWMEQAARAARNYKEFESYTRRGLVAQLRFEGYTRKQAEYGADSVGY